MKTTCIVGGNGFIGQHLVNALLKTERNIIVVGRRPLADLRSGVRYVQVSEAPDFYSRLFEGVDEVIHLAYSTTPKTSYDNPVGDIIDNLANSVRIFESLISTSVRKVLYVSSGGTVYGQSYTDRITEDHSTNPISPYGITKLAIEKYAHMFHQSQSLPVIILRPSNAYGEGQKPFKGQGFIATAIGSILRGDPVTIFGESGTVRDYIYVGDLVNAIMAVLNHGIIGSIYNCGTGIGYSNLAIYEQLAELMAREGFVSAKQHLPARPFDVRVNILDSDRLFRECHHTNMVDIEAGLSKAVQWQLMNKQHVIGD